jgi:uncharacterized glyoxalase superfamily protein PhnB
MADPFDALRLPDRSIDPDPAFAARLRARVETALTLPRGVQMSSLIVEEPMTRHRGPAGATITPYLAVRDAASALDWYGEALGATRRGEPIVMPDGRIGHAELEIAGAVVMLADEHPEIGFLSPEARGVSVQLHLQVDDVDGTVERVLAAGATLERPVADVEYGRRGLLRDPFGHRWIVTEPPPIGPRHGDIGYVSLWVPDAERAAEFFAGVLGWSYAPGSRGRSRQVQGLATHHGVWGGEPRSTLFCCFAVDDVDTAGDRVRAAGGQAEAPHEEPYGRVSECVDDQGVRFAVFTPPGGTARETRAPATGAHAGDIAYVTLEVVDSARTRAFYRAVLGWRFTPGRVDDGWQVEDTVPMVGVSGGHDVATTVPMYRVDDIAGAVEAVRARGGTATDPEVQPYGISSACTDDQGTRFYLGAL